MTGVRIRVADSSDAAGITRVYMESAAHHARIDPERCYLPDSQFIEDRYREGRQHPEAELPSVTLVAEFGGDIVGFLDAQLQKPFDPMLRPFLYCFVADVAVAESHRDKGIGQQLMESAESWARQHNADYMSLMYNSGNARVRELYARLGYEQGAVSLTKRL